MNAKEKETLREILHNVRSGKVYGTINKANPWVGVDNLKHECLWQFYSESGHRWMIGWDNYGRGAIRDNLKDLEWLISAIFEMKPSEFVATYTTEEA